MCGRRSQRWDGTTFFPMSIIWIHCFHILIQVSSRKNVNWRIYEWTTECKALWCSSVFCEKRLVFVTKFNPPLSVTLYSNRVIFIKRLIENKILFSLKFLFNVIIMLSWLDFLTFFFGFFYVVPLCFSKFYIVPDLFELYTLYP